MVARRIIEACRLVGFIHITNDPCRPGLSIGGSAQLGAGGVGLGRGVLGGLGRASVVRHRDEVGGDVIAQQAPRT
jgi:hypothetical protein